MLSKGSVVRSISGHDKDSFYCVLSVLEDRIIIADGKFRKLEKPKVKNVKHLRATKTIVDLEDIDTNKKLIAALKPFNQPALLQVNVKVGGN